MILLFSAIIMIACTAAISSDIYAPSIPDIAKIMNVHVNHVQLTMPCFMLGVVISMLASGVIMDIYGRKKPLIYGFIVFVFANLIAANSGSIASLFAARLIQGFGAGVANCAWRSIFRDNFSGADISKYGGYCAIVMSFMAPAAPFVGGLLHEYFSWAANFYFMAFYGLIALTLSALALKDDAKRSSGVEVFANLKNLMQNRVFLLLCLLSFLFYGTFFSWLVIGPVLIISTLKYSPSFYGLLNFVVSGLGFALGGFANGKLVTKLGVDKLLSVGAFIMLAAGIIELLLYYIFGVKLAAIYLPFFILCLGFSFVFSNIFSKVISPSPTMAGLISGLYGSLQVLGSVVFGYIAAYLPDNNQTHFAELVIIISVLAIILRFIIARVESGQVIDS